MFTAKKKNRSLKRRKSLLLSLVALLGLGGFSVIGAVGPDYREVDAAASDYTKVTKFADLDASKEYVLGILDVSGTTPFAHSSGTSSWGKTSTTESDWLLYTVELSSSTFRAKTTISGTSYYLQIPTSNTFSMTEESKITSSTSNLDLAIGTSSQIYNSDSTTRHLRNNGNSGIRSYANSTGDVVYFYEAPSSLGDLQSIDVTVADTYKKDYKTGDAWEEPGANLKAMGTYSSSTEAVDITDQVTWTFDPAAPAENVTSVNIKAALDNVEGSTTVEGITFTARQISSIEVKNNPTKTSYGLNEAVSYEGLVITVHFDDETSVDVSDLSLMTFNPAEGTTFAEAGTQTITGTYEGVEFTFTISVSDQTTGSYTFVSNGDNAPNGIKGSISGGVYTWAGDYVTMVQDQGTNTSNPVADTYDEIRVYSGHNLTITPAENTQITKVSWTAGDKNQPSASSWSNASGSGTSVTPTNPSSPLVYSGSSQARFSSITIDWAYTQPVPFGDLDSISIQTEAETKTFTVGDTFSSAGLAITAKDTSGTEKIVNEGFTTDLDGHVFTSEDVGTKAVTVSYTLDLITKSTTYEITVLAGPIMNYTFATGTAPTKNNETVTFDEVKWTFSIDTSGGYIGGVETDGFHIGSNNNPTGSTFRSEIISGYRISRIEVTAKRHAEGDASLSVSIGNAVVGTENLTATSTEYGFDVSTPVAGHISINFAATEKAYFVSAIKVYGEADTDGVAAAARLIEAADVCAGTGLAEAITAYDALSETAKAECDKIMLDDYKDGDIDHASAKTYNRLSVAEKMIAIRAANVAAVQSGTLVPGIADGGNGFIYILILGAAFAAVGAFLFFKRRKTAE